MSPIYIFLLLRIIIFLYYYYINLLLDFLGCRLCSNINIQQSRKKEQRTHAIEWIIKTLHHYFFVLLLVYYFFLSGDYL